MYRNWYLLNVIEFSDGEVELALYTSIEENETCCICGKDDDDATKLGKKGSVADITAHHFCLLFSSNLRPSENADDIQLFGFSLNDIKKEVSRAGKLVNMKQLWFSISGLINSFTVNII